MNFADPAQAAAPAPIAAKALHALELNLT